MNIKFQVFLSKIFSKIFWYLLVPVTIFIILSPITFSILYSIENIIESKVLASKNNPLTISNSLQIDNYNIADENFIELKTNEVDFRGFILDKYFEKYNSPLKGYGYVFVEKCDKYNAPFDCTTLPAIAYVETKLCTLELSYQQHNCWGWGGSPQNRIVYKNFNDAIDAITKGLVNNYGIYYMSNPASMQYKYCGPNCHTWGSTVQQQRNEIRKIAEQYGFNLDI